MKTSSFAYTFLFVFALSCTPKTSQDVNSMIQEFENIQDMSSSDAPWPTYNDSTQMIRKERLESFLSKLDDLDQKAMSNDDKINKDMLSLIVRNEIEEMNFGIHEFPLNAEGGFLTGIIYSINGTRITNSEQADAYLEKLKALPDYIEKRIEHMTSGSERGVVSPKLIVDLCLGMVEEVVANTPENTFLFTPAKGTDIESEVWH